MSFMIDDAGPDAPLDKVGGRWMWIECTARMLMMDGCEKSTVTGQGRGWDVVRASGQCELQPKILYVVWSLVPQGLVLLSTRPSINKQLTSQGYVYLVHKEAEI